MYFQINCNSLTHGIQPESSTVVLKERFSQQEKILSICKKSYTTYKCNCILNSKDKPLTFTEMEFCGKCKSRKAEPTFIQAHVLLEEQSLTITQDFEENVSNLE